MRIRFHADASHWARFAANAESALSPQSGPMEKGFLEASDIMHDWERQRFMSASYGDGTWEVLKPRTLKDHDKIGDEVPTVLHFFGNLEASLHRGAENHVLEVTERGVIEGTEDPKARFHQDGVPENNLPARIIIAEPPADVLVQMKPALVEAVAGALRIAARG